jgi:hypothetical protein
MGCVVAVVRGTHRLGQAMYHKLDGANADAAAYWRVWEIQSFFIVCCQLFLRLLSDRKLMNGCSVCVLMDC